MRCCSFSLAVPATASPATSPFTSARKTGTPIRLKPSARVIRVTVLPVPVAPAIRPWRLPYFGNRKTLPLVSVVTALPTRIGSMPVPVRRLGATCRRRERECGACRFYAMRHAFP
jgi:hypothetical protein